MVLTPEIGRAGGVPQVAPLLPDSPLESVSSCLSQVREALKGFLSQSAISSDDGLYPPPTAPLPGAQFAARHAEELNSTVQSLVAQAVIDPRASGTEKLIDALTNLGDLVHRVCCEKFHAEGAQTELSNRGESQQLMVFAIKQLTKEICESIANLSPKVLENTSLPSSVNSDLGPLFADSTREAVRKDHEKHRNNNLGKRQIGGARERTRDAGEEDRNSARKEPPVPFGEMVFTDPRFAKALYVAAEPVVSVGGYETMLPLSRWLKTKLSPGAFEAIEGTLHEDLIDLPSVEELPERRATEADCTIELPKDTRWFTTLPFGMEHRLEGVSFLDSSGNSISFDGVIRTGRFGGAEVFVPEGTSAIKYRISIVEGVISLPPELAAVIRNNLPQGESYRTERELQYLASIRESTDLLSSRASLWVSHQASKGLCYSLNEEIHSLYMAVGDAVPEAVQGLRVSKCNSFATLATQELNFLGIPSMILSCYLLESVAGAQKFKNPGHAVTAYVNNDDTLGTVDLTTRAEKTVALRFENVSREDWDTLHSTLPNMTREELLRATGELKAKLLPDPKPTGRDVTGTRGGIVDTGAGRRILTPEEQQICALENDVKVRQLRVQVEKAVRTGDLTPLLIHNPLFAQIQKLPHWFQVPERYEYLKQFDPVSFVYTAISEKFCSGTLGGDGRKVFAKWALQMAEGLKLSQCQAVDLISIGGHRDLTVEGLNRLFSVLIRNRLDDRKLDLSHEAWSGACTKVLEALGECRGEEPADNVDYVTANIREICSLEANYELAIDGNLGDLKWKAERDYVRALIGSYLKVATAAPGAAIGELKLFEGLNPTDREKNHALIGGVSNWIQGLNPQERTKVEEDFYYTALMEENWMAPSVSWSTPKKLKLGMDLGLAPPSPDKNSVALLTRKLLSRDLPCPYPSVTDNPASFFFVHASGAPEAIGARFLLYLETHGYFPGDSLKGRWNAVASRSDAEVAKALSEEGETQLSLNGNDGKTVIFLSSSKMAAPVSIPLRELGTLFEDLNGFGGALASLLRADGQFESPVNQALRSFKARYPDEYGAIQGKLSASINRSAPELLQAKVIASLSMDDRYGAAAVGALIMESEVPLGELDIDMNMLQNSNKFMSEYKFPKASDIYNKSFRREESLSSKYYGLLSSDLDDEFEKSISMFLYNSSKSYEREVTRTSEAPSDLSAHSTVRKVTGKIQASEFQFEPIWKSEPSAQKTVPSQPTEIIVARTFRGVLQKISAEFASGNTSPPAEQIDALLRGGLPHYEVARLAFPQVSTRAVAYVTLLAGMDKGPGKMQGLALLGLRSHVHWPITPVESVREIAEIQSMPVKPCSSSESTLDYVSRVAISAAGLSTGKLPRVGARGASFKQSEGTGSRREVSRMDVDSYREYQVGDDTRFVDQKILAKTDKAYVKLAKAHSQPGVLIVADVDTLLKEEALSRGKESPGKYAPKLVELFARIHVAERSGREVAVALHYRGALVDTFATDNSKSFAPFKGMHIVASIGNSAQFTERVAQLLEGVERCRTQERRDLRHIITLKPRGLMTGEDRVSRKFCEVSWI